MVWWWCACWRCRVLGRCWRPAVVAGRCSSLLVFAGGRLVSTSLGFPSLLSSSVRNKGGRGWSRVVWPLGPSVCTCFWSCLVPDSGEQSKKIEENKENQRGKNGSTTKRRRCGEPTGTPTRTPTRTPTTNIGIGEGEQAHWYPGTEDRENRGTAGQKGWI